MQKNSIIQLEITGMTAEGQGVGRHEGLAVFVPDAAPGDLLCVRIVKMRKNLAYGRLEAILKPSPDRIKPDCPVSRQCGGCVFRHISYEAERKVKWQRVADALRRIGGFSIEPQALLCDPDQSRSGYRNKAQYPVGTVAGVTGTAAARLHPEHSLSIGFYAPRSHRIVDCRDCRLQPPEFAALLPAVERWAAESGASIYDEKTGRGLLRHIYLRKAFATGQVMATLVINGDAVPQEERLVELLREAAGPRLVSIQLNRNTADTNVILGKECRVLYGTDHIVDRLYDLEVKISALSFYQVNRAMAERLYRKAAEYARPAGKILLDLYCGAGTIGLSMARQAKEVIGVEIVPQAVEDARENARRNGVANARFLCADAAEAARQLADQDIRPDVVLVDPPRKGCAADLLRCIGEQFRPDRLVYVSCDPATLARDCRLLTEYGYRLSQVTPVDLFPGTAHVETAALLLRDASVDKMRYSPSGPSSPRR